VGKQKAFLQNLTINCNSNKCSVWSRSSNSLGLAIDSWMDKRSVPISHDAKLLQYMEPHSSLAIICNHSTWDIGFCGYINVIW